MNKKNMWTFIALILVFVVPLSLAWGLYYFRQHVDLKALNKGELINPTINKDQWTKWVNQPYLNELLNEEKWVFLFIQNSSCEKACQQTLYKMRQVRLALGENMKRIQRIVFIDKSNGTRTFLDLLRKDNKGVQYIVLSTKGMQTLTKKFPKWRPQTLYLIDPQGRIIIRYPTDLSADALLKDVSRLLKVEKLSK